ncbi:hypothetical protein RI367_008747, partial [Sorochytrium milnesiophthora]
FGGYPGLVIQDWSGGDAAGLHPSSRHAWHQHQHAHIMPVLSELGRHVSQVAQGQGVQGRQRDPSFGIASAVHWTQASIGARTSQ